MRPVKVLIKYSFCILSCLLIASQTVKAQSNDPVQIAREYFTIGEFDKARVEFEKLAKNKRNIPRIHDTYLNLLLTQEDYSSAEKYVKKVIKDNPDNFEYEIDLATVYRAKKEEGKIDAILDRIIDREKKIAAEDKKPTRIRILANKFFEKNFREKALEAYTEGRKAIGKSDIFALDLANLYRVMNMKGKMVSEYLNFSKNQPQNLSYVKNSLQNFLREPTDLDTLEIILYDFIQKEPGKPAFNDLLVWTHLQQKNFPAALRQARALDRRLENNGDNIMNVGMIAYRNSDYKSSQKAFNYILNDFVESPNRRLASRYTLLSEEEVLKSSYPIDTLAIENLIIKYGQFIEQSRDVFSVIEAQRRVALLQAFQLNKVPTAIETLTKVLEQPVGRSKVVAEAKMDLADIYLLNKEPWESILLYGQVERMFKDEPLGYMAKLKSAKLSYFKGDFELAQSNLDILKLATSREIANDALDLSILIKNNTVFDSTDVVMQDFANIELMLFQNQKEESIVKMDSMLIKYNSHSIVDELLFLKANTLRELGDFTGALESLKTINDAHYFEILGDDSLFLSAKINEEDLKNYEVSMALYNDLLKKFPGSIFVAEARTRFRELRGDFNN
ncbi:tetratricopeptide repeat protein [Roseivirga sp.]|uniref:tetratricopeptide repeat protein n=1 Tax=Roseivirga sp. TaxID=1964215 RepID=UPI003B8AAD9F